MVPVMYRHVRPRLRLEIVLSAHFLGLLLLIFRLFYLLWAGVWLAYRYEHFNGWFRIVISIEVSLVDKDLAKIFNAKCLIVNHNSFQREIIKAQWCFSIALYVLDDCFFDSIGILFVLNFLILDILKLLFCQILLPVLLW